ncbi:MAG: ribonuclease E inhibitor RraB [Marmoricola sp.]
MKMIRQRRREGQDGIHPGDEILLQGMAGRGELKTQFRWLHHMYFANEGAAQEASRRVTAAGWTIDWMSAQPAPFPGWVLRAGRDVVITRAEVQHARTFFETLARDTSGSYAGWDVGRVPKHALS